MTIINRQFNFVFLKSAKTAGSAIESHFLTSTVLGGDIWHTSGDILKRGLPLYQNRYVVALTSGRLLAFPELPVLSRAYPFRWVIREHYEAEPLARQLGAFWDKALKVTSIRNPWDIMVSGWSWRRDGRDGNAPPIKATFEEWVKACLSSDPELQNRVGAYDPKVLMHPYLFRDGKLAVDMVIRQENIDDGMQELSKRLDRPLPPIAVREKTSNRKRDYRKYYTDDLAHSVGEYFTDIVNLFDYRFD